MVRTLTRSLLLVGATFAVAACGGEKNNNNNSTNNKPGTLKVDAFTASAQSVASGDSVTLSWTVSGADAVSVTVTRTPGGPVIEGATNLSGTVDSGPITEDTTFKLTVTGAGTSVDSNPVVVTVDSTAVSITSFTATPNPAAQGGTVTLSWATAGATKVTLLEGTTELLSTTTAVAVGTSTVGLTEAAHTYTLRAENDFMSVTEMVTVTTETPPAITTFTVSPNTFTGASADVTITFAAEGETFTLTGNGTAVTGFTGQAAGNLTVTVTETTVFEFTASGAGQTRSVQAAVAQAVGEVEPNDDKATATPITAGATGSISPDTDVDFYSFTVPAGGNVFADITDGMGGCNFLSLISLYNDTDDDAITTALFGGVGDCAQLDPRTDTAAADLPAGTYYISVSTLDTGGDYSLVVLVGNPGCGNSIVEASASEQCDDGNMMDGDGCTASCQIESAGAVSGLDQTQTFSDSINPATSSDFFQVTLPSPGYINAETGVPVLGQCVEGADTRIFLRSSTFELLGTADDTDDTLCGNLTAAAYGFAPLDAGTYWVEVESYAGQAVIAAYQVRISTVGVGCGNGVAEMGEACDDGNTTDGDGCSSTCQLESAGTISGTGGTATVPVGAQNDIPGFVTVVVTDGQSITATTTGAGGGACPFPTNMGLFDVAATIQYGATFGGAGCAFIDPQQDQWAANLAAGSYLLGVANAGMGAGGPVEVTVTIGNPVCGNGIIESRGTEQCDDGNMVAGDGCSATCQFEGNVTQEMEMNNSTATANPLTITPGGPVVTVQGHIDPVGDLDHFSFTVPMGQTASLVARTYPTFGDPTSCNFDQDTLVELLDSTGMVIAENDDDGGRTGFCSLLDAASDSGAGNLAAGTYYVLVRHYDNTQSFQNYFLDVQLVP